jgi:hypothetical protein
MKKINYFLSLKCFFILLLTNCSGQSKIIGTYIGEAKDLLVQFRLEIKDNGEYTFLMTGDRSSYSKGFVVQHGSYLNLYDSMSIGFSIAVREGIDSSFKSIRINPARYNDTDVEINAFVWPNNDSAKACLVTMNECNLKLNSLNKFRITVGSYASKTYYVKSPLSNVFDIYIQTDYPLYKYQALKGYKISIGSGPTIKLFKNVKELHNGAIVLKKIE